jgi:hypothetical protein
MRTIVAAAACLLLAGCANDQYAAVAGETAVPMSQALSGCKHDVLTRYAEGQSHIGAVLLGPLGALLDVDSGAMKASDIDPAIESCMADKGYVGTSEN